MKKSCFLLAAFLLLCASQAFAYELLVLSGEKSKNSKRWAEEVLPGYPQSTVGKMVPAKVIPILGAEFPKWIEDAMQENRIGEVIGTPTFIIWDADKKMEAGRVEGYTDKAKFHAQMEEAMEMIAKGMTPGRREGSGGHEEGSGGMRHDDGSGGGMRHEEGSGGAMPRHEEGSGNGHKQEEGSGGAGGNIMDHIYKTPEEATRASKALGFGGQIHTHETPEGTIYMPGPQM